MAELLGPMPIVELRGVSKRYGRTPVLHDVSLTVCRGTVLGLVGANGAGKTTLLRLTLGLVRPDTGTVRLHGLAPPTALARHAIAYFGGEATLPDRARARRWAGLFAVGRDVVSERRRLQRLSRGTRQLVGLKVVLTRPEPTVVLLDEPWEGLDPDGAAWLASAIRARRQAGAAVIVSSHRLADLAPVCDACGFLHAGVVTTVRADDLGGPTKATADTLLRAFERVRSDNL